MLCTILLQIDSCGGLYRAVEGCREMCTGGEGWRAPEASRVGGL